jgi:hypothetical protein
VTAARAATTDEQADDIPLRDVIETTTPCPTCATVFTPVRRQRYCTPAFVRAKSVSPCHRVASGPSKSQHRLDEKINCASSGPRRLGAAETHQRPAGVRHGHKAERTTCRQSAWRARHHDPTPPPVIAAPPRTPRRPITVYQCPVCQVRRLGQQWCHDCTRPAVRVGPGGLCPQCDEPVAISDLTDQHPTRRSHP